jgi:sporulation protein YlmC with PRC-barrel domain
MKTASGHTTAIRAKKVIGTKVKDKGGNTIGDVQDIVLDKLSNNIMFAVVSFGGFLGMGERYHAMPWSTLNYDEADGNYVVGLSREKLQAGPAYSMEDLMQGDGMKFRDTAYDYYEAPRYW